MIFPMRNARRLFFFLLACGAVLVSGARSISPVPAAIPSDFPSFRVPGLDAEMAQLRALFWEHFIPEGPYWDDWLYAGADRNPGYPQMPAGPKATLWDEWLCGLSLWPAVESGGVHDRMVERWNRKLSTRRIDGDGYVDTDQGFYFAHSLGWPFPVWSDGGGGRGWHFSFRGTPGWYRPNRGRTVGREGWAIDGVRDRGIDERAWNLALDRPDASVSTPPGVIRADQAPFLQLRWTARGLVDARPRLEWTTRQRPDFEPERSLPFPAPEEGAWACTMIPVYKHPGWTGEILRLRIRFGNAWAGAEAGIQSLCTAYDTRQDVNNLNFARGCTIYFRLTRDLDFLRRNIDRIRTALRFALDEFHVRREKLVLNTWPGHDGLGGPKLEADGSRTVREGQGLTDNWWDMLPFGFKDFCATVYLYDALETIAGLEEDIRAHPEWAARGGMPALDPADLRRLAAEVRAQGNKVFWSAETGRFAVCIDREGRAHDYGFVSPNLEAIHFGFAYPEKARSILSWIAGERQVEGDTARGRDIYRWRFAPLTTTRRNTDWWSWPNRGDAPWGAGIQDGGCVLGFSYYDLMARLKVLGPDGAWGRLKEILAWFNDVKKAGGYKDFYARSGGRLQGGSEGGNLGITQEFWESAMVPQIMLDGFMGFKPTADGFRLDPRLPASWPELAVDRVFLHGQILALTAAKDGISMAKSGPGGGTWRIELPGSYTKALYFRRGKSLGAGEPPRREGERSVFRVDWSSADAVRFEIGTSGRRE